MRIFFNGTEEEVDLTERMEEESRELQEISSKNEIKSDRRRCWKWIPGLVTVRKFLIVMGLVCSIGIIVWIWNYFHKEQEAEPKVSTVTTATIMDLLEISDMSTVEYMYNAITTVYEDPNGSTAKYHVYYKGTIKSGIDFQKVEISVDNHKKMIQILLPESEIQETLVDESSLDFIFEKNRYDEEMVYQEAYTACCENLAKRAKSEEGLLEMAKENAKTALEALLLPWLEQSDEAYQIEIQ